MKLRPPHFVTASPSPRNSFLRILLHLRRLAHSLSHDNWKDLEFEERQPYHIFSNHAPTKMRKAARAIPGLQLPRFPALSVSCICLFVASAHAAQYLLMGTLFWQQLNPNNRTVQFELHTAWKYVSNIDGIRACQCTGVACGSRPSPCSCACSGNLGFPIVGDKMLSLERFVFGDGNSTSAVFTVMALDPGNDVLFAKTVITHEYSFTGDVTEFVAGFYYENRPNDIENDPGTEVRVLCNIMASSFHMTAKPADLVPGSQALSQELTKRGNSPQLSSALPLSFDIPESYPHTFSFPAKVRISYTIQKCFNH